MRPAALLALCAAGQSACRRDLSAEFPAGLEPLEDNEASWPSGDHPEDITFAVGAADDYDWAHARAYVRAPLDQVFPALRDVDACVDRRAVDEWTVDEDTDPDYEYSAVIHNVVHDIITVEFDVSWRHGQTGGQLDDLQMTGSRWQKTDGSSVITLLEGSLQATAIDEDITGLEFVEHLDALQSDSDTIVSYLGDYYADILALAHGQPLPETDR